MNLLVINNDLMVEKDDGLYIEKITGFFLEELVQSNIKVEFLQFRDNLKDNDCRGTYNILNINSRITIVSILRFKNKIISYLRAYFIGIFRVLKNDYLYLFYPNTFFALAFFAKLFGKKYGLYLRGEQGTESIISRLLYKHANIVFTVSPVFTEMINARGGKAVTIAPMIDIGIHDIAKNRKYFNKDIYNLLYLGRLEEDKGVFELIEAIYLLINSNFLNIKLNFVGDGPDLARIKNLVKEYNLESYIKFHGTVPNKEAIKDFYLSSDLIILPSYHEGFPRILYEAMLLGVPILTTFVGTVPYLMKDGYNCYSLKIKNANSIVEQIKYILLNYSERAKVAINATKTVAEYLSKYSESHSKLLSKVLME